MSQEDMLLSAVKELLDNREVILWNLFKPVTYSVSEESIATGSVKAMG